MTLGPGLQVAFSNRLETLAAQLAAAMRAAPVSPLAAERIVVPHPLLGRWLRLQLAAELGIAAQLTMELPAEFAWSVMRAAVPNLPATQPFGPRALRWRLFGVLEDWQGEDPLRRYLADGDPRKRFELADRLAGFYDRCLLYRGDWIRAWEAGEAPHWQARLWQAVCAGAPRPAHWIDAVDAYRAVPKAQQGGQLALPLPTPDDDQRGERPRVSFFGVAALSPSYLQMLRAVTASWEVRLYVSSPCAEYWADAAGRSGRQPGVAPADQATAGNELLAAWGRPAREMQHLLAAELGVGAPVETYDSPEGRTRLAAVQRDIVDLRLAAGAAAADAPAPDASLQIHACHSAMREAEVLHDRLLGLLDAQDDLEAADILVLTPDLDEHAPAIEAVFGAAGQIPFHIGRQRRRAGAAVRALMDLLALPGSRYGIGTVLAPLACGAVQRRFGIAEEDLPPLRGALARAGVCWGIDADHVAAQGLPGVGSHTWRHGLRRLLLGYALAEQPSGPGAPLFAGVAPCELSPWGDEADPGAYEGLGRLTDYCELAFDLDRWKDLTLAPGEWAAQLRTLLSRFFDASDQADDDGSLETAGELVDEFAAETEAAGTGVVPFRVLRDALAARAAEATRGLARLADGVAVARLAFGEVLPAQVVAVLGMNDAVFPRRAPSATFDLVAAEPRRGDRDRRDEDRYAFLDALLAARRCLLVSYVGRDLHENATLPPSAVVAEFLDYLRARFPRQPPAPCQHPLQPFSSRYFPADPGAGAAALFSYSAPMAAAATALGASPAPPDRFAAALAGASAAVPASTAATVRLTDLMRFAIAPVAYFMTRRLGMAQPRRRDLQAEDEPLEAQGLTAWQLRRDLLALALGDLPGPKEAEVLRARGLLPNGNLGAVAHQRLRRQVADLVRALAPYAAHREAPPQDVEVAVGGVRLLGTVQRFHAPARELLWFRAGAIRPQDRIAAWLQTLALCCTAGRPVTALLFGIEQPRDPRRSALSSWRLEGLGPGKAAAALGDWVAAWRDAERRPLPLFPATSLAWAEAGEWAARQAWHGTGGSDGGSGEGQQPFHRLTFPHGPFGTEFADLAERLLDPLAADR